MVSSNGNSLAEKWKHNNKELEKDLKAFHGLELEESVPQPGSSSAEGIKALELIQRSMQQTNINPQATSPSKTTIEDLMAKMKDPRYYDPARRDRAFVQEVTDGFKRI